MPLPQRDAAQTPFFAKIEAAREALNDAEEEIRKVVGDIAVAPRAEKALVSELVRHAFSKLRASQAKLEELEKLVTLAQIEAAKSAIVEAEKGLDRAIEGVDSTRREKMWMSEVVAQAFAKLTTAKQKLIELEESMNDDSD